MLVHQEVLYSNFINSLKSPETKKDYSYVEGNERNWV